MTEVAGVPLMVGGVLVGATLVTVIEKAGKDTLSIPSLTVIVMPLVVPTSVLPGVPLMAPFALSKLAHEGRLVAVKLRVSPSASLAVGIKL